MAIRKSGISGIPFGNTAARPASPSLGQPYFNGEVGRLELYSSNGWQNIVQETPGVSSASGTYNQSTGSGTFIISGTNFVDGGIAYAVGTNATEYQATTTTYNSIVQMTALFTGLSPDYEPYDIKVVNPSNLFGFLPDAFYINDNPVWTTSSGSLGTFNSGSSVSLQLAATDDESESRTYTISSGSLPGGLSMSSSGLISGTIVATNGTSSFTVSVSDGVNTGQTRSFSITCLTPVVTGGTLSSDSTYYYRTFTSSSTLAISNASLSLDALVIGGGGSGGLNGPGQGWGCGGGAGGAIATSSPISLSASSHTVVVGGGANSGTYGSGNTGNNGTDSYLVSATYSGKGGGGGGNAGTTGASGGCGGGSSGITRSSSTQTSPTGYTGYGNGGGIHSTLTSGGGGIGATPSDNSIQGGSGKNTWSTWLSAITPQMSAVAGWSTATSSGYIAGGGAGSDNGSNNGGGGAGGGGAFGGSQGSPGTTNTGSGGGGTGGQTVGNGGYGGSGIVIVRYTKASVGG